MRDGGHDLLALRSYQPQDDVRRIDWKATARTRQLTVREFAAEDEKRISVIFDTRIPTSEEKGPSIRDKIAAEQSGKPVVVSQRFETGASITGSILARFTSENAETQLIVGDEPNGFGFGFGHARLHESLRRLALAFPDSNRPETPVGPELDIELIVDGSDDSHFVLVTANGEHGLAPGIVQRLKIIRF